MLEKASILAIWRCQCRAVLASIPTFGKVSDLATPKKEKAFPISHSSIPTMEKASWNIKKAR
jgi:hypothetical protein